jgi:predicted dehydrogenase
MKVGLIGTGTIAENKHLPILYSIPDVQIVAVCDDNKNRLSRVAQKFKIKNKFTSIDDMLKDTDADIVHVTTPGYTHYEIAKKALLFDKNVLIEKPATLKATEAEELGLESSKRNLKLGVCYNYRFSDPVIQFQKIREGGGIGQIDRIITIQHGSTIFALPPWFWDEELSGGILFELGTHAVDLQCYLMGTPKKVTDVRINYDKSVDFITSIFATIEFESGIGVVDLKWHSSSSYMHQYISGSVADAIIKFYPDGFILQQGDFSPLSECMGELRRIWNFGYSSLRKNYYKKSVKPHRIIIEDFVRSVKSGNEPLVPISSIIPTIKLLEEIWSKAMIAKKAEKIQTI